MYSRLTAVEGPKTSPVGKHCRVHEYDHFISHEGYWLLYFSYQGKHVELPDVQPINILELQHTIVFTLRAGNPALLPHCAYYPLVPVHVSYKITENYSKNRLPKKKKRYESNVLKEALIRPIFFMIMARPNIPLQSYCALFWHICAITSS